MHNDLKDIQRNNDFFINMSSGIGNQVKYVGNIVMLLMLLKLMTRICTYKKIYVFANPKSLYEVIKFDEANNGHASLVKKKMTIQSDASSDSGIRSVRAT